MVIEAGAWVGVAASVMGSQHVRSGLPNQDAVALVGLPAQGGITAAVADGHGGDRYVRSADGARLAVAVATQIVADRAGDLAAAAFPEATQNIARTIIASVVAEWRRAVRADHQARSFGPDEYERAGVNLDEDPFLAYGATLLCVAAFADLVVMIQVGDGDVRILTADGQVIAPVPGDDRLVGGATTSLAMPDAAADARIAVIGPEIAPVLVLLATDGYGNAFTDTAWAEQVLPDLRHRMLGLGTARVETSLPSWLADSAEIGGDDVTVAVLSLMGPADPTPADSATIPAASSVREAVPAATSTTPLTQPMTTSAPPPAARLAAQRPAATPPPDARVGETSPAGQPNARVGETSPAGQPDVDVPAHGAETRRRPGRLVLFVLVAVLVLVATSVAMFARSAAPGPDLDPDPSATAPGADAGTPGVKLDAEAIVSPGGRVQFLPSVDDPAPVLQGNPVSDPQRVVLLSGRTFCLDCDTTAPDAGDAVDLDDLYRSAPGGAAFSPAGLHVAAGLVWVLNLDASLLDAIHPTSLDHFGPWRVELDGTRQSGAMGPLGPHPTSGLAMPGSLSFEHERSPR